MIKIIITGSHLTPAEALIEQLPKNWQVYKLSSTAAPKFRRYDWWGSLWSGWRLPGLIWQFKNQLQLIKPAVVVSFGGYASVPVVIAAKLLDLPIIIHEQTFRAGLASKITGRLATVVAISWKSSRRYFPSRKTVLTGNPLRRAILGVKRSVKPVIYICGGHQGSQIINQTVESIMERLLTKFTVYHQYGQLPRPAARRHYIVKPYFKVRELARIYSQAELIISRAGINTVTELGFLKLPAVLIPLPFTQKKEQDINARYLEKLGLAVVLSQNHLTPAALLTAIAKVKNLSRKRRGLGFPRRRVASAARSIFKLCLSLLQS